MKSETPHTVTLEELLRLKRAERPTREFWDGFDRELRAKQLAAIVEKRPWWRTVPQLVRRFARLHLPVGATAVLALSIVSLRQGAPSAHEQEFDRPMLAPSHPVLAHGDSVPAAAAANTDSTWDVAYEAPEHAVYASAVPEPAPVYVRPGEISQVIAMIAPAERPSRNASPASQAIAINLEPGQMEAPDRVAALGGPRGFEARVMSARAVEPLAQIPTPHEAKRARYLDSALPSGLGYEVLAPRSSERLTRVDERRLLDDDSISRIDARGDRVSFSF